MALYNGEQTALWVASAIPQLRGASMKMQSTAAYVYSEGDSVVIGRRAFPLPDDVDVMVPIGPKWTRVEVGERHVGHVAVPWPLRRGRPYLRGDRADELVGASDG